MHIPFIKSKIQRVPHSYTEIRVRWECLQNLVAFVHFKEARTLDFDIALEYLIKA